MKTSKTKTKTKGPCAKCGRIIKLTAPANVGGCCSNAARCSDRVKRVAMATLAPINPRELSAKRRDASLKRWAGKERIPYKSIRLSARAVDMIRADAARRGVSASQAVIDALEGGDCTLSKVR